VPLEHRERVLGHVAVPVVEAERDQAVDRLTAAQRVHRRHDVERLVAPLAEVAHLRGEARRGDGQRVTVVTHAVVEEDAQSGPRGAAAELPGGRARTGERRLDELDPGGAERQALLHLVQP
jgi:hypothetical protein